MHTCSRLQPRSLEVDALAVLEMEVMKYVAYCGGTSLTFRVDRVGYASGGGGSGESPAFANVTWGLASRRPCATPHGSSGGAPACTAAELNKAMSLPPHAGHAEDAPRSGGGGGTDSGGGAADGRVASGGLGAIAGGVVAMDNVNQKPLHMICTQVWHVVDPHLCTWRPHLQHIT